MTKAFADCGHAGDRPATATCIDVEIVRKPRDPIGFAVHPKRWVVERFFDWISRNNVPGRGQMARWRQKFSLKRLERTRADLWLKLAESC